MSQKRRTQKYLNTILMNKHTRLSIPNIAKYHPLDHSLNKMIQEVVQQLLLAAEYQIHIKSNAQHKFTFTQDILDQQLDKYFSLNSLASEPHQYILPDSEPSPIPLNAQPSDNRDQEGNRKKIFKHFQHIKQKSQSCDVFDSVKKKEKCLKQLSQMKKCTRNEFISVKLKNRLSQNEDHSEEIQQLLRRKKQLILEVKQEAKQSIRNITQVSKRFSIDKKQKYYGQNDEGQIIQLIARNPVKLQKEPAPIIKLSHIKVLSGQQAFIQTNMKKKPILQLPITRKNKKRKDVGDTCVLIQQMFQCDNTSKLDQEQLIQEACRSKKGIRFTVKQQNITPIIRLPTIR